MPRRCAGALIFGNPIRGAGVGVSLVSPLGPLGLDLGYGFDRTDLLGHPAPGFQLHFRLGGIGGQ